MSDSMIPHTIRAGERWDSLAYRYYGDVFLMTHLVNVNPQLAFAESLPQGETIFIPVIKSQTNLSDDLPPWLRGQNADT